MKKKISLILAIVLIFTTMSLAFSVSAADDASTRIEIPGKETCEFCEKPCTGIDFTCTCCAACSHLDPNYKLSCVTVDADGKIVYCCADCDGVWPCDCHCDCKECKIKNETTEEEDYIFPDDWQDTFTKTFRDILDTLIEVFDNIFEVLRGLVGLN